MTGVDKTCVPPSAISLLDQLLMRLDDTAVCDGKADGAGVGETAAAAEEGETEGTADGEGEEAVDLQPQRALIQAAAMMICILVCIGSPAFSLDCFVLFCK